MRIEIAKHERMSSNGRSVLRVIQNQEMPLLDLFVRESIQNSLDASSHDARQVSVNFKVGTFSNKELSPAFETIDEVLNERYGDAKCDFLAIRDTGTDGLTGPIRYSQVENNNFGNLLKLVYEIGKEQQNEGAGGSFGYGKSIYYRMGIGLVLFYSRIKEGAQYKQRLAACLIEDESSGNTLLKSQGGVDRGIAWWGDIDEITPGRTIPITNPSEIKEILEVFGMEPYEKDQTGTTIIIPYLDTIRLLNEVYSRGEQEANKPYWTESIGQYLSVASQRWYAPRLLNARYEYGPYLAVYINDNKLKVSEMLPMFKVVRELYIIATGNEVSEDSLFRDQEIEYKSFEIEIRKKLKRAKAGVLASVKLTKEQLEMTPPNNQKSPYQQIVNTFFDDEGGNAPIVFYTRRPGMIVGYDFENKWSASISNQKHGEYVLAFFVLNSNNELKEELLDTEHSRMTLEEYIRGGEKADHAYWQDNPLNGDNPKIVKSIKDRVRDKLKTYSEAGEKKEIVRQNIGLSSVLAELLLPPTNFGNAPEILPVTPPTPRTRTTNRKTALYEDGDAKYEEGKMTIPYRMVLSGKPFSLVVKIDTDFKKMDANYWEKENSLDMAFPLKIETFDIDYLNMSTSNKGSKKKQIKASNGHKCFLRIDEKHENDGDDYLSISGIRSSHYRTLNAVDIIPLKGKCEIKGTLTVAYDDQNIKYVFDIKEEQ